MHPVLRELFLALHWFWCAFSAPVLPWMDKDARVKHRVDVGTEWILSFKVGLVHLSSCMNAIRLNRKPYLEQIKTFWGS